MAISASPAVLFCLAVRMSGLFTNKYKPVINIMGGIRVQTSLQGVSIPIIYGRARVAPNLVWYGDFFWKPVQSGGKKGSSGGGTGKKAGGEYDYGAAVILGLCQGPIQRTGTVWSTQGNLPSQVTTETYVVPGAGGSYIATNQANYLGNYGVTRGDAYSVTANDFGSPGSITLTGTQQTPMIEGSVSAGHYTRSGTNSATYNFSAADAGKTMSITYSYSPPFTSGGVPQDPIASIGFTLFKGSQGQAVWSYLTSKHPSQAIGYTTLAYLATPVLDLGMSGVLPNFNFEVFGLLPYPGGTGDCNPSDVLFDVLTNQIYGCGFDPAELSVANYLVHSQNLKLSPWGLADNGVTVPSVSAPSVVAPDGSTTGTQIVFPLTGAGQNSYIFQQSKMQPKGRQFTFSIYLKASSGTPSIILRLVGYPAAEDKSQSITLSTSWVRYSVTGTFSNFGSYVEVGLLQDVSQASKTIDAWGAQLEISATPSTYVPTTNMPAAFANYSNYCIANGLFISPAMDTERIASDWIKDILDATNAEIVESGGFLNVLTYGDTTVVANGTTFTPNTQPIYNLTADSFIRSGTTPPIEITRPTVADAYNSVRIEYCDRNNSYNPSMVEAQDLNSVSTYKYRPEPTRQYHMFATQTPASLCAATILARLVYVRNRYKFKLPQSFILLDPMDLVTVPAQLLGMAATLPAVPVRILTIDEQEDRTLDITAEQFPWGCSGPTLYPKQALIPGGPNVSAPPGSTNVPIIFEALSRLNNQIGHTIWFGVCGGRLITALAADNFGESSLGSNWGSVTGTNAIGINASTDFQPTVAGSTASAARWLGNSPFPADQSSKVTITAIGGSSNLDQIGVAARMDPSGADTFYFVFVATFSNLIYLYKVVSGVVTLLSSASYTPVVGDQIEIRCYGTLIRGLVNGNFLVTAYDSSISTGQPGIYAAKTSSGLAPARANNWVGGQAFAMNPNWGGCQIYISDDGTTYQPIATAVGACTMGVLTATLASHADPDTTDTLSVDLGESAGSLASVTSAQADLFASLCYVDGELIAYQNATLTREFQYDLATKLRRGVYGSTIGSHAAGTNLLLLNDVVEGYDYDASLIGKTVYFKFVSFNQSGLVSEELANVTAYSYTITGSSIGLLTPAHASYVPTTNPLTGHDAGSSATINIAAFSIRIPGQPDIPFGSGAISGLSYNTLYYIYLDDPGFLPNPFPTYVATTAKTDAVNSAGRMFVGSILTPLAGAIDTAGNGDGGAAAQLGMLNILGFSAAPVGTPSGNASVSNPTLAIDGDTTTSAALTATANGSLNSVEMNLTGPAGLRRAYQSATVFVTWDVSANPSGTPSGTSNFLVHVNYPGGTTVLVNIPFKGGTQAKQTSTFVIPKQINLSQVVVQVDLGISATDSGGAAFTAHIYDAHIEAIE
jgi:putative tail protein